MQETISAIDVGTTKICALMAQVTHDTLGRLSLQVIGEGQVVSKGIRRGVVVDVAEVSAAVGEAIEKCERDAGREMLSAYVGIAGSHIAALNSKGASTVDRRNGVTNHDMLRALEVARAVPLPQNQEVLHTIARQWLVDGESSVQQPLGMVAHRLEVDAHIVTGSSTAVSNLAQCVTAHGIDVDELVLEPLAANKAVLKREERRMGVAVVDMGGGTSDIAIFIDDGLCNTVILDLGGNHLTHDIAMGLHAPFETAEELKLRHGSVLPERIAEDETVWATVFGDKAERSFSRRFICEILEARATEILEIIYERLEEAGYQNRIPAGVVLTGGSSQLHGMADLGRRVLGMPVRIGVPSPSQLPITGLSSRLASPTYATTVGLLLWGLHEDARSMRRGFDADQSQGTAIFGRTASFLRSLLPG